LDLSPLCDPRQQRQEFYGCSDPLFTQSFKGRYMPRAVLAGGARKPMVSHGIPWYPLVSHGRLGFAHHFGAAEHAWHSVAKPSEGAQSLLASTSPAGEQSAMDSVGQAAPQLKQRRVGSTVKSNGRWVETQLIRGASAWFYVDLHWCLLWLFCLVDRLWIVYSCRIVCFKLSREVLIMDVHPDLRPRDRVGNEMSWSFHSQEQGYWLLEYSLIAVSCREGQPSGTLRNILKTSQSVQTSPKTSKP
jgi:hypothetical protein